MTHLGLLQCGQVHPAAQRVGGDYPERFAALLAPFDISLTTFAADQGELPSAPDELDGWLVSGSRASVLDEAGWLRDTGAFLAEVLRVERPLVGLCFGHQLLAQVAGGRVDRAASGWGVGVQTYEVVDPQPWMRPAADRLRLIASHEDQVVELPPHGRVLARADYCPIAMMAVGERAIGVQPHPEFDAASARRIIDAREELFGAHTAAVARESLGEPLDQRTVAAWIATFVGVGCPR